MTLRMDKMKAVILVDEVDLGHCPVGSKLPRALWPLGEGTVLENLIQQLAGQGVRKVAVCWDKRSLLVEKSRRRGEKGIYRDGQDRQDKGTAGVLQTLNVSASDSLLDASICEPGKKLSQSSGTDAGSAVGGKTKDQETRRPGEGTASSGVEEKSRSGGGGGRSVGVEKWSKGEGTASSGVVEKGSSGEEGGSSRVDEETSRLGEGEKSSRGEGLSIRYILEDMPRGAGGRLFDAAGDGDELLLVLKCNIVSVPDINEIIDSHTESQADMTIGFGPDGYGGSLAVDSSQVYLFERSVLKYITKIGYCDIKEGLIPKLVASGKKIHAFSLSKDLGSFKSWQEYLGAVLCFVDTKLRSGEVEKWRSGGGGTASSVVVEEGSSGGGTASSVVVEEGSSGEGERSRGVVEESRRRGEEERSSGEGEKSRSGEDLKSSVVVEEWSSGGEGSRRVVEETRRPGGKAIYRDGQDRQDERASSGVVEEGSSGEWVGGFFIDESVRIVGAVVVCDGAHIAKDAIIIGPAIIGPDVRIGKGATVIESVLWDGSRIGSGSVVQGCLTGRGVRVAKNRTAEGELLTCKYIACGLMVNKGLAWFERVNASVKSNVDTIMENVPASVKEVLLTKKAAVWAGSVIIFAFLILSYWEPTISGLWQIWMRSDEYSSGLLVPLLAGYILWSQRKELSSCEIKPCILWGVMAFMGAQAMRFLGLWFMYSSAERLSLILTVIAVSLLLFGWRLVWRIAPVLIYLFFMLPLPNRVQLWIAQPLQQWATTSAVFGLEMLGYDVVREGNVINLNGTMVAVAEACNGLRMLTAFFVISGLVALLVNRKWWEKLIIFASSIPIAFACNTLRLIITAIAFTKLNTEHWEKVFHDFGGLAMMPLALGIIVLELWLLSNLVVENSIEDGGAFQEDGSGVVYKSKEQ